MVQLIAFAGHIGAGKDECAKYLVEKHGYTHLKFAETMQDIVALIGNFYQSDLSHRELFKDREWKSQARLFSSSASVTIREAMQHIGEDLKEHLGQDIWINSLSNKMEVLRTKGLSKFCISDLRFPEEYKWLLKNWGGYLVYILNDEAEKNSISITHRSEKYHEYLKTNADYFIINNPSKNTIDDLHSSIDAVLNKINNIKEVPF